MANEKVYDKELERKILVRAATDPKFRKKLLADARGAVADVAGAPLPADLKIKFIERDANVDVQVVLPPALPAGKDLTPEELDLAAGGWCIGTGCGNTCELGSCQSTASGS